jgi:hypothetical protein
MRNKRAWVWAAMILSSVVNAAERDFTPSAPAPSRVLGWVEKAMIQPGNVVMNAKMDTGALTSSLDAKRLTAFQRDGKPWVRFDVEVQDDHDNVSSHSYEREVVRQVTLRGAGGKDDRPVVLMKLCIGDQIYEEEFTLRDRGEMKYPLLIGRRTIAHVGVIDVTQQYVLPLKCAE